ncbi:MAG: polysaccharide pyruvyl transferase family protein [Acidimicrobiales bacterium]
MRIGIAGWFGSDNLGDEVLLATTLDLITEFCQPCCVMVLSANPSRVSELHAAPALALSPPGYLAKMRALPAMYRELRRLDVLVIGPGTVFQERAPNLRWPGTLPLFLRLCLLARLAGRPVVLFGAAVREETTALGRVTLRIIGRCAASIGARDQVSAGLLSSGAQVIGDVAAAWRPSVRGTHQVQRFAVSLKPLPSSLNAQVLSAVSETISDLTVAGLAGDFVAVARGRGAVGEDDRTVWQTQFSAVLRLIEVPLERVLHPEDEWISILGSYQIVIAARLHTALLALKFATPIVAIAHEEKLSRSLTALGLGGFVWTPGMPNQTLIRMVQQAQVDRTPFLAARNLLTGSGDRARGFLHDALAEIGS